MKGACLYRGLCLQSLENWSLGLSGDGGVGTIGCWLLHVAAANKTKLVVLDMLRARFC